MDSLQNTLTREDWLNRVYRKSRSEKSLDSANAGLVALEQFTISKYKKDLDSMIRDLRKAKGDRLYIFLDNWVSFMDEVHPEIVSRSYKSGKTKTVKRRSPATIQLYFTLMKSYLRSQGIKINSDDVRNFVQFPTQIKEPKEAITKETIKILLDNSSVKRRAFYLTLISSGMRPWEALSIRKRDFDLESDPIRITIPGKYTKKRETRETYVSSEAKKLLLHILKKKKPDEKAFSDREDTKKAEILEEVTFSYLREKCGFTERYPETGQHKITLYSFRSFFYTQASMKHGPDYAHALTGHGAYMPMYYRLEKEERARQYQELEPRLLIYTTIIDDLQTIELKKKVRDLEDDLRYLFTHLPRGTFTEDKEISVQKQA